MYFFLHLFSVIKTKYHVDTMILLLYMKSYHWNIHFELFLNFHRKKLLMVSNFDILILDYTYFVFPFSW